MKLIFSLLIITLITGCAQSGYKTFYTPHVDINTLSEIELLATGIEPEVIGSNNFSEDLHTLRSKGYISIGQSLFNGGYEDTENAATQAKKIGATLVLVSAKYTNTSTTHSTLLIPDNKTTYHSGTANSQTAYNNSYGSYLGSSNSNSSYSGTSTSYGTKAIPITKNHRLYDFLAIYLVKSTKKFRFGLSFSNLTPSQRIQLERNTGVYINVVLEGSPTFYANVLPGDVLISVDSKQVYGQRQAAQLMNNFDINAKKACELIVIRKEKTKKIMVNF